MPFTCSICEEESTRICVACTKDSCENHLCEKCSRCSDCCGCEVALSHSEHNHSAFAGEHPAEPPVMPAEEISAGAANGDFAS
jgi:hypothetical protein